MPDLLTVAGIALKTSVLIAIAGFLAIVLHRQSAAFSHLLWTATLALCVLLPFAVLFLPSHTLVTLPSSLPSATHAGEPGWGPLQWTLTIWLFGCSCVLARELLSAFGLARWRRHAHPLSSSRWSGTLSRISTEIPHLRVFESTHIASPCTWGFLRPVLLLPSAGDAWPEAARHSAVLHELAHVRRLDALSTLISRLACALHWYNPLVWLAAQRVRTLQERACDDAVLRAGAMPSDYAQFLLDVAAHMSGMTRPRRWVMGMAHSSLRSRIVAILDPKAPRAQPHRARMVAACATLFACTVFLATASVAVEPPPEPTNAEPAVPAAPARPAKPAKSAELPRIPALPKIPEIPTLPPLPQTPTPPVPPAGPTS
jgi:beta-lactamase regulating signal transducer with metallopeptidase domain